MGVNRRRRWECWSIIFLTFLFILPSLLFCSGGGVGSSFILDSEAQTTRHVFNAEDPARLGLVAGIVLMLVLMARSVSVWAEEVYFFKGFKQSKAGWIYWQQRIIWKRPSPITGFDVNNDYELAMCTHGQDSVIKP